MKNTVEVMPSILKEAERHFTCFKNNDGPSNQSGASAECT